MFDQVLGDVRLGLRRLIRTPAASITVIAALSAGIGLCALMFSIIDGAIFSTLPFENGDRIVRISRSDFSPISTQTYRYWEERQTSFERLGLAAERTVNLAAEGRSAEPASSAAITVPTLALLSVEPVLGRAFAASDAVPGAPGVALISSDIWHSRFDGDPEILGRIVRLSGEPVEIVGVMEAGFGFPFSADLWTPMQLDALRASGNRETNVSFGVLRRDVAAANAAAELNALDAQVERPATATPPPPIRVTPYTNVFEPAGTAQIIAGLMLAVALLVLLVACANVTNVLLARAAVRSRDVAVRSALGASRARIATQFLIEVLLLASGGAVGGTLLVQAGADVIRSTVESVEGLPFWWDLRVDLPVLAVISVVAMLAAVLAGVTPAVFAARSNSHELLKDASRTTSSKRLHQLMRRLIGAEMAVSLVLLVAAGLFIRSAINLRTYEFSFEPESIYTSVVSLPEGRYENALARGALAQRLEESLTAIPQAASAAVTTAVPGIGDPRRTVAVEGTDLSSAPVLPSTRYVATTPGFFPTFLAGASAGRLFDSRDSADGLPVAIVSTSFEQRHLPQGAVGHRIALPDGTSVPEVTGELVWLTIVGVVPDLPAGEFDSRPPDAVYVPFAQAAPTRFQIAVRSRTSANALATPIRQAVASVDQDTSLSYMRPLDDAIEAANAAYSWLSALFLVAGGLALSLAAIGLYGVMAFWVTQRTREIGLRIAIGGNRRTIVGFVLRRGMTPIVTGLAFGMLCALPAAWALRGVLLDVAPFDPFVFGTVLGILVCAGSLGCLLPAMRATRIDPQAALMSE